MPRSLESIAIALAFMNLADMSSLARQSQIAATDNE